VNIVEHRTTKYSPPVLFDVSLTIWILSFSCLILFYSAEGTLYTAKILDRADLNRQIVRSASCEILIPELDLTLPPTSRGQLTTVEGLICDVVADLSMDQPLRRIQDEDGHKKIQILIDKMKRILGEDDDEAENDATMRHVKAAELQIPMPPFTVKLDDPAGNSFIEFIGDMSDPKWNLRTYHRTLDQNIALGLVAPDDEAARMSSMKQVMMSANADTVNDPITDDEVFVFPGFCSSCGHQIDTHMKKVNIPYFEVSSALRLITGY
jgi:zinc finger protein